MLACMRHNGLHNRSESSTTADSYTQKRNCKTESDKQQPAYKRKQAAALTLARGNGLEVLNLDRGARALSLGRDAAEHENALELHGETTDNKAV